MIVVSSPDYRVQFRSACAGHADRYHFFKGKAVFAGGLCAYRYWPLYGKLRHLKAINGRTPSVLIPSFLQGTDENARRENQIRGGHPLSVSCPREVQGRNGQAWL